MRLQLPNTAVVTMDYAPDTGGIAVYWNELTSRLKKKLYVIAPSTDSTDDDVMVVRVPFLYDIVWPRWLCLLFSLLRLEKMPEHMIAAQVLPIGTVVYILWRFGYIQKYSVSCHGMDIKTLSGFKKKLANHILRHATYVVANSKFTKHILIELYTIPPRRICLVYPGVAQNIDTHIHHVQPNDTTVRILSVGRLVRRKGFDMVIKSLEKLDELGLVFEYHVVGSGADEKYLHSLVGQLPKKIHDRVFFYGRVSEKQKKQLYLSADIFALPSRDIGGDVEGFGIVNIEASMYGLPVIAGKSGGVGESVIDGKTGILVDGESLEEVTNALKTLAFNPHTRQNFGIAGQQHATQFSWDASARSLQSIL